MLPNDCAKCGKSVGTKRIHHVVQYVVCDDCTKQHPVYFCSAGHAEIAHSGQCPVCEALKAMDLARLRIVQTCGGNVGALRVAGALQESIEKLGLETR